MTENQDKSVYTENAEDREETRKSLSDKRKQSLEKLKEINCNLKCESEAKSSN